MIVVDCRQGSPEWWEARRGVPTSSNFDRILTAKTLKPSAQAEDFICELIGDRLSPYLPENAESYTSNAMRHGQETEAEARRFYTMETGLAVHQVGFCLTDDRRFGCSPDGLVFDEGGLELKCPLPKTHAKYLLKPASLIDDYRLQVHGSLIVTGRQWWDVMSYAIGFHPVLIRVTPDETTEKLRAALEEFHGRLIAALAKVKGA